MIESCLIDKSIEKQKEKKCLNWEKCMFYLNKKKRYCNFPRIPEALFCGNHIHLSTNNINSKKCNKKKEELRQRIPCPFDSNHTIYLYNLVKHKKICSRLKEKEEIKKKSFYTYNINSEIEEKNDICSMTTSSDNLFTKLAHIDFTVLSNKIRQSYEEYVENIQTEIILHNKIIKMLQEKEKNGAKHSILRHIRQQASILGQMEKKGFLNDNKNVFVEFGAGRGMLSLALSNILPTCKIVLIDRSGTRRKADGSIKKILRRDESNMEDLERIKIDIRHFNFKKYIDERININSDGKMNEGICYSKHLCGSATDLMLKSVTSCNERIKGISIALCCHNVCTWHDYVNKSFFLDTLKFSQEEFSLIALMTSWGTSDFNGSNGKNNDGPSSYAFKVLGCSDEDRSQLGLFCKRLIDMGRILYLRSFNYNAYLVYYCEKEESLENCLLVASPN